MKIEDRFASADILKVMAITAVVFIHGSSLIPSSLSNADSISIKAFLALMLRFCVPIFFFLWAYFQEKSTLKHGAKNLIRARIFSLLIPFIFWSFIYFIVTADFKTLTFSTAITKHWTGYGWAGQYYFIILFQLILLFPLLRRLISKIFVPLPLIYTISILFYLIISYTGWFNISLIAKIGDRMFIYWLPYVVLGIIYAHKTIFPIKLPLIIGVIFILLIPLEFYYLKPQTESNYLLPSVFLVSIVMLSSMEIEVSYLSFNKTLQLIIQFIAKNTLAIFCLNPLVYITLSPILRANGWFLEFTGSAIINPFLSTLIIMLICLLIASILKKIKLAMLVAN